MTRGPILRTLVAFSLPTLGTNLLQTLGMTINAIWIGQLLGDQALAATANANTVMFLAFATVFGFSIATTVKMGLYFGGNDIDRRAPGLRHRRGIQHRHGDPGRHRRLVLLPTIC